MLSKLIQVIGWKRFELNRMLHFDHVVEATFQSVLRHCLVVESVARFLDSDYLRKHPPDHEEYGVFARDPKAIDLLTSGPGVAAGHVMQLARERQYDETRCRAVTSQYVLEGRR